MKRKNFVFIFILMCLFLFIDQVTKWIVVKNLMYGVSMTIIPSFFSLTYVKNTGAAWSMFMGNQKFLILMSLAFFLFFIFYIYKKETIKKEEVFLYALLLGGIFGNLMDRLLLNYVIDFLDFDIFGFHFPVFNVADIFIVLAGILLMIKIMKEESKDEV